MGKEIKIYKCNICGNTVLVLEDGQGLLMCCNEGMKLQIPNTNEASSEKHTPVIKEKIKECFFGDCEVHRVQVGSVEHPMTKEHRITWIGSFNKNTWTIQWLEPNNKPESSLIISDDSVIYENCNIHGLWTNKN